MMERGIRKILTFVKRSIASKIFGKSFPRMTEQIQILQRRLECISRDLKVLWIALNDFSMHLGGNRRWVPLSIQGTTPFRGHKIWSGKNV